MNGEKKKLKAAQSGDVDAFAELFEQFRAKAYGIAFRIVGANDAHDVVMESSRHLIMNSATTAMTSKAMDATMRAS